MTVAGGGTCFPEHICILAREDNPVRCDNIQEAKIERCRKCRSVMQGLMWEALYLGDRSLAAFLLPHHMAELGVTINFYECLYRPPSNPAFTLGTKLASSDGYVELFVVPRAYGGFTVYDGEDEDRDVIERDFQEIEEAYNFFHVCHIVRTTEGNSPIRS